MLDHLWNSENVRIAVPLLILLSGLLLYLVFNSFIQKTAGRIRSSLQDILVPVELIQVPFRVLFTVVVLLFLRPHLPFPEPLAVPLFHALKIFFIVAFAWFLIRLLRVAGKVIMGRFELDHEDNLEARRVATQIELIRKVLNVIIIVLAVSAALMTFDAVRQIGISLLASAGVAGIILGFAAQKSIATLIAGIQIAVTQPIRNDDVVIVENQWGRIEEITLTYVVVRIWDQRRLIVPVHHFLEQPFENWTRTSAELIGAVLIYADYNVPTEDVRNELKRIVEATPLWDKRVVSLQVTNTTEKTIELRALVSAANSSDTWDLRCHVREKLLDFLQRNYPDSLPKMRIAGQE
ncbi:MAG: mechanosensitive ion channel family protein [Chlorobium sp.]|nr:mechanosensitive ion channel family protein [Chlorobium sp.]MCW8815882.1 mechanosensitive ion channel family protein [Chlorobium sp.]MCW8818962.1 mechanosensitive ion channel family protein [Ignavibacteriaceae bacterium]